MPTFTYKAKDARGRMRTGTIEARSKGDAKAQISRRRLQVVSLRLKAGKADDSDGEETPILGEIIFRDANGDIQIALGNQNPTTKELIVFTKQFSTMLNSGVPMIQALGILAKQQQSRVFRKALRKIQSIVENGSTLSDALSTFPQIFDSLYVAMVEAGEASGNLDTILIKLVTYIEKAAKIKGQVKSAMMYPVIVVVVAIGVITGLLAFVVPTFAQQYSDTGRQLPGLTQIVIDFSNNFIENWYIYFGSLFGGIILFNFWVKTDKGRKAFDAMILRAPGLGILLKKIAVGRFCSTMSSMLTSGVNLLEALTICASSAGNKTIEEFILGVRSGLEKGSSFSDSLSEGNLFPEMVISMVTVGESTGALDDMLTKVSEFYEEEVDLAVQTLLSMIEPIMIVFIGGLVGFIVIAMYLPVFEMAGGIAG
ncbi:MAG: type II secretion system F family protein [Oligoflexales bacterium]|nr:type II secretion system F family protein [Oligoflexales bacterium]